LYRSENTLKKLVLRILISAILFSLACGIVVAIIGLILKWNTSTQFSNGFFWAGAIIISLGMVNLLGTLSQRTVSGLEHSQSAVHLDMAERFKIWEADVLHGYHLLAFLGISGVLLLGLSGLAILVGRLF
jgi:hypothetical protein